MVQLHTILHPTDFSEHSKPAFQLACSLAREHGARLVVLHVAVPPMTLTEGVMTPPMPLPDEYGRPRLEAKFQELTSSEGTAFERRLVFGSAAEEIIATANEINSDLIVMGTHGRTGIRRVLLGSTAEHVLRKAKCPVLTIKPKSKALESLAVRRILCPTDFSSSSKAAFELACTLAHANGARVIALHVALPHVVTSDEAMAEAVATSAIESSRRTATEQLAGLRSAEGDFPFEQQLEEGDAAERILDSARVNHCDLIVLGSHGRTGLSRLLMGSVAEQVIRKAPCAVLVVKTSLAETAARREGVATGS
jgi:nucleotide-binding universal stress UspA family protein